MNDSLKVYVYQNCDTCRKALKFLDRHSISYTAVPIREKPPAVPELQAMLEHQGGDLKKLCNVSGQDYRALNLKEKIPSMGVAEVIDLLSSNGNLIKRPFVLGEDWGLVGFREEEWRRLL